MTRRDVPPSPAIRAGEGRGEGRPENNSRHSFLTSAIQESHFNRDKLFPFNRYFYQYQPPRELAAIESDIESLEKDIVRMLAEITRK